ncbi:hypothetical protein [Brevibacillus dissolubilis]|uniref:hypothetical protein n=1 Tax=Brevibacillus dissolubilis TaxID=1844116 RepID=UPI001116B8BB|nr:hypothetical protein [Brevibacillus dissolubilis]
MKYNVVIIQDGEYKKIKLPREVAIVEYVLSDMESFRSPIFLDFINRVLDGKSAFERIGGNICSLEINKDITVIYTDFPDDEGRIETSELKNIIDLWVAENKNILHH